MKSNVQAAAACGAPTAQRFNALKHGRRSNAVLLPGDDVADFRKLRRDLFHLHKPCTIEEAMCVENIAACHWRILRAKLEQTAFKDHLGQAVGGGPEGGGYLGRADPHVLHHRAADCGIEEVRLNRIKHKEHAALTAFQKQRAQQLHAGGADVVRDYREFMEQGEPVVEEPLATGQVPATSASSASRTGENFKQSQAAIARTVPKHWSRRQREAAARREMAPGEAAL